MKNYIYRVMFINDTTVLWDITLGKALSLLEANLYISSLSHHKTWNHNDNFQLHTAAHHLIPTIQNISLNRRLCN